MDLYRFHENERCRFPSRGCIERYRGGIVGVPPAQVNMGSLKEEVNESTVALPPARARIQEYLCYRPVHRYMDVGMTNDWTDRKIVPAREAASDDR